MKGNKRNKNKRKLWRRKSLITKFKNNVKKKKNQNNYKNRLKKKENQSGKRKHPDKRKILNNKTTQQILKDNKDSIILE
jgi:hypothetical protein